MKSLFAHQQYWIVGTNVFRQGCLNYLTNRVAVVEINAHNATFRPLPWAGWPSRVAVLDKGAV